MRRPSQNVNDYVYETGLSVSKIDPLGQARVRQMPVNPRSWDIRESSA